MLSLSDVIDELLAFLARLGLDVPSTNVLMLEVGPDFPTDSLGRLVIPAGSLVPVGVYDARFAHVRALGPSWINFSSYGLLDGSLIVGVELPSRPWDRSALTSINYSGPSKAVLDAGWDANAILVNERKPG